jgi:endoglucanase
VRLSALLRRRHCPAFLARRLAPALVLIVAAAGCGADPLTVQVIGSRLADRDGKPIRLLGLNRSSAEYACLRGQEVFEGPTDRRAIAAMTAWRINTVRIPLNEHCWLGINGTPAQTSGEPYRSAVTAYVTRLQKAGLRVVLDLHWNGAGTQPATGQRPMADLDHAPAFWSSVAKTFKAHPGVLFDLYNEPHDISWRCWRDGCLLPDGWRTAGMQTLVNAVRSAGARQPIILTGNARGSDLSSWLRYRPRDPENQLIAGFHVYDFSHCSQLECWKTVQPVARRVPVVTSEFGQRACGETFLDRFMTWADSVGISYLGWAWNPSGCAAPALIDNWAGRPTPSGQLFRGHLARIKAARVKAAAR